MNSSYEQFVAKLNVLMTNYSFRNFSQVEDIRAVYDRLMTVNCGDIQRCLSDLAEMFQWELSGDDFVENGKADLLGAFLTYAFDNYRAYFEQYCHGMIPKEYRAVIAEACSYVTQNQLKAAS